MLRLTNPVRHYDWGSAHALPELLGTTPDGRRYAEIWVGAHPAAPSVATQDGAPLPLDALVAQRPHDVLGPDVRARFGDRLPYLVKLLAADRPLSLQVHPDRERAARRHAEEVAAGVPAAERRYPDPWHKPELLVALRPTVALAGLRSPEEAAALLAGLGARAALDGVLDALLGPEPAGARLRSALGRVLALPAEAVAAVACALGPAPDAAVDPARDADPRRVAARLAASFPDDPGVVASFLLHPVVLRPGDGLAVGAGRLHCYVAGVGLEVMASSDNVLRAGLTPKVVDAPELLAVLDPEPRAAPVLRPAPVAAGAGLVTRTYGTTADEFALTVADVDAGAPATLSAAGCGPRTVVGLAGVVQVATRAGRCGLGAGESVLVPAADGPVALAGRGTCALVGVPAGAGAP